MGRKRQSRLDLPERVYYHHGAYYFVHASGKWEKLDNDYLKAMARWAELIQLPERAETVGDLLDRYIREVMPHKAPRTQKDNLGEVRYLRSFFGAMGLGAVEPKHVAQYRDSRSAKTRGNREVALLSHAFTKAAEWGLVVTNPCREVKRNKEKPRDRYITDAQLETFKEICPSWLKQYIDVKLQTGLRQQDLLRLARVSSTETHLVVCPMKTKDSTRKRLAICLTPSLISSLNSLPKRGTFYFTTRVGNPYSSSGFGSIWRRLMTKYVSAGHERFHEHDIRGKVATDMEDPVAAQKLLGHASIKMTEDYIKQRSTDEVQPHRRNT